MGNQVTDKLLARIDSGLQTIAQINSGGLLSYTQIIDFSRVATKKDCKIVGELLDLLEDEQGTNDKTQQAIIELVKYRIGIHEPIQIGRYAEVIDNWGREEASTKSTIIAGVLMKPKDFSDDMYFEGTGGYPGSYYLEDLEGKLVKVGKEVILVGRYDEHEPVKSYKLQ